MTQDEIAKVAGGLTGAQKRVYTSARLLGRMPHSTHDRVARAMERKGLLTFRHIIGGHGDWTFTEAGIAVRDFLRGEDHG
jgi:hypothetical protein